MRPHGPALGALLAVIALLSWSVGPFGPAPPVDRPGPIGSSTPWTPSALTLYGVTFAETGLPSSTFWSVTVNGNLNSSSTASIAFQEPNGSYSYVINAVAGYRASPLAGSLAVTGANVTVPIVFAPVTYALVFNETGLYGQNWSVTLVNRTLTTTGSSITFRAANGSFAYAVTPPTGFSAAPSAGTAVVSGANVVVPLAFSTVNYTVTITESGLPAGTNWSVALNGVRVISASPTIGFTVPNGSYSYAAGGAAGYSAKPSGGVVLVSGSNPAVVHVTFTQLTYTITFVESGLSPISWGLKVGTVSYTSTSTTLLVPEPNGTYSFTLKATGYDGVPGWNATPKSGAITVNGANPSPVTIKFTEVTYLVTFTETGLSGGWTWGVSFRGYGLLKPVSSSTNASTITVRLPNGTYMWSIGVNRTFTPVPWAGNVTISGKTPKTPTITMEVPPPAPPSVLGFPVIEGYIVLALLLGIGAGIGMGIGYWRGKRAMKGRTLATDFL